MLSSRPFLSGEQNRIDCDSRHDQNLDLTLHFAATSPSSIPLPGHSKHADALQSMDLPDEEHPPSVLTESSLDPGDCGSTDYPHDLDDLDDHYHAALRRDDDWNYLNAKVIDDHASARGVPILMNQYR